MNKLLVESTHKGNYHGTGAIRPLHVDQKQVQGLWSVSEDITPEVADQYLEHNINNRKITQAVINRYARDMKAGLWRITHQGIAFDEDGNLIDGQQRLMAIIQAKVTIRMLVTRGVPRECNDGIDGGRTRSVNDILHFQGKSTTTLQTAIAGLLIPGAFNTVPSRAEVVKSFYRHENAIYAVTGMYFRHKPRITIKAVLTPVVRAWYSADREKLRRFVEVLLTGESKTDDERVILRLRDFLLLVKFGGSADIVREIYAKTERTLSAYLNSEMLAKVVMANRELFPLPGEGDDEDTTIN